MRFTDALLRNVSPEPKQRIIYDDSVTGFGLRISPQGTKAFVLTLGRDRERITIGRYPIIGLSEARTEAKRLLAERTLGKQRPSRLMASEALTHFIGEQEKKNRAVTVANTHGLLLNHFPKIWRKPLEEVDTDDITTVTDKLLKKGQAGAANHAFTAIRTFLRWCVKRRYIKHSPVEALDLPSKAGSRERVLSDEELRVVWKATETIGGNFGKIVQLLVLTGQRRSEIGSLQTSWCSLPSSKDGEELGYRGNSITSPQHLVPLVVGGEDTDESGAVAQVVERPRKGEIAGSTPAQAVICIPSTFTKNKRSHTFPIGSLCTSILKTCLSKEPKSLLFPARNSSNLQSSFNGWSKAKAQLDKKVAELQVGISKPIAPWTLHDCRRSLATNWQRLGISTECIEAYLNHVSGSRAGIVGVYQRHRFWDEMVEATKIYENWFKRAIIEG